MNILVLGSGGREHAIAYKFSQSKKVDKVFVSSGNAGMTDCAEIVDYKNFEEALNICKDKNIDLVFVGPENPLADGLVDFLESHNVRVVGPSAKAAQLEASKDYAKEFMARHKIPTAKFQTFSNYQKAKEYIQNSALPIVLKADGLAAGKGVVVAFSQEEALNGLHAMMNDKIFSEAGAKVVIEEFLSGWETSIFAFSDGENFVSTIFSQDHKQAFDGDKGPNTGGMGAFAPVDQATKFKAFVDDEIIAPTIIGMKKDEIPYKGVLFVGLMMTDSGPKVIEYNCRFGDPETQVILSLLKTDLLDISNAIIDNNISNIELEWYDKYAVTVMATSKGYPEKYEKGKPIDIKFPLLTNSRIYYSGVKLNDDNLVTNGGRVLAVTSTGDSLKEAINSAYEDIQKVNFDGITYRSDIGSRKF